MTQAVVLDVGGTFVKYGVVTDGAIGETGQFPIRENGTAEEILGPILTFLTAHPRAARGGEHPRTDGLSPRHEPHEAQVCGDLRREPG